MKKFIQVSLVVVLLLSVAFGLFQAAGGAVSVVAAEFQPNVGWNKGLAQLTPLNLLAYERLVQPMVGWNS